MRSNAAAPLALAVALLSTVARALVVTLPTGTTVWDTTGAAPIYINWALYPLTFPPPASQFFDIYVRNGVGGMYQPFLNQSIARAVDASSTLFYEVPATEAVKFVPGTGYQLFFSDPMDASVVYCQSEVFSIGTDGVSTAAPVDPAASSSPALPSSTTDMFATLSSNIASESSAASLATQDPAVSTPSATATSAVAPPSASHTAAHADDEIEEASSPGGLWQQGGALLFGSANQLSSARTTVAVAVAAAGLLWIA